MYIKNILVNKANGFAENLFIKCLKLVVDQKDTLKILACDNMLLIVCFYMKSHLYYLTSKTLDIIPWIDQIVDQKFVD